jgi:hypothetical protein
MKKFSDGIIMDKHHKIYTYSLPYCIHFIKRWTLGQCPKEKSGLKVMK